MGIYEKKSLKIHNFSETFRKFPEKTPRVSGHYDTKSVEVRYLF